MFYETFLSLWFYLFLGLLILSGYALIHAALQREDAFRAADKQTKPTWLMILGGAVAVQLVFPWLLLVLVSTVATIVYLVDVRPALRAVTGGGGRGGWSSSDGPYGPYNGGR
ncbi:Protein of unknown function [Streptomyces zhaozhouensis]|uniref:DUF2516 family protein n=1 Tax=Streptomyces zhaozhouensis TaxID=1300267 RepID=A0A286E6S6_9ACTN|nr:DUF2516 family protein [Streptomyces zhaozhouensis]SOD66589.1 Protein of unknown function [Streptomyces zhaozhouensis]